MDLRPYILTLGALLSIVFVSGEISVGGRIVGGIPISIQAVPYQVSLQAFQLGRRTKHFCGGSIISDNLIVTAAHCVVKLNPQLFIVLAGTSYYNRGGVKIRVEQIIVHENYSRETQDYDIALIKLTIPLRFNSSMQPIALPNVNQTIADNTTCLVSGWGDRDKFTLFRRAELRAAEVPLVNYAKCYQDYIFMGGITNQMLCAGFDKGGKDACQGDSGGPLACKPNGIPTLIGIVSWGHECAKPNYPGVYSNVQVLRSWIQEKTGL